MTIGQPLPRPDGRAKVTGRARYAADHDAPNLLHAVLVTATIPAGRVEAVDARGALAEPGVVRVLTDVDMPRFGRLGQTPAAGDAGMTEENTPDGPPSAQSFMPMQGDEIRHEGQPVAIVLGETLEAAEAGARLVKVGYGVTEARLPVTPDWAAIDKAAVAPRASGFLFLEPEFAKADAGGALARAANTVEAVYLQPTRHHNAIEPSAVFATWDGDLLMLHDSTQHVYGVQQVLAARFRLPLEKVRVIAQHTGGGFGGKGWVWPHEVLAAAAARIAGRPVKLVLTRANLYSCLGYQPRMAHKMALGADAAGCLTAVTHDVVNLTTVTDDFPEYATEASKSLYAAPALRTSQRMERANVAMPTPMRAPVEGPGLWALESAIDELAASLDMDPLDLRLINYAEEDSATGQPWSSKKLREAYEEGARLSAGASARASPGATATGWLGMGWRPARWARSAIQPPRKSGWGPTEPRSWLQDSRTSAQARSRSSRKSWPACSALPPTRSRARWATRACPKRGRPMGHRPRWALVRRYCGRPRTCAPGSPSSPICCRTMSR